MGCRFGTRGLNRIRLRGFSGDRKDCRFVAVYLFIDPRVVVLTQFVKKLRFEANRVQGTDSTSQEMLHRYETNPHAKQEFLTGSQLPDHFILRLRGEFVRADYQSYFADD